MLRNQSSRLTSSFGSTSPNWSFLIRRRRTREYPKFSDAIPRDVAPVLFDIFDDCFLYDFVNINMYGLFVDKKEKCVLEMKVDCGYYENCCCFGCLLIVRCFLSSEKNTNERTVVVLLLWSCCYHCGCCLGLCRPAKYETVALSWEGIDETTAIYNLTTTAIATSNHLSSC